MELEETVGMSIISKKAAATLLSATKYGALPSSSDSLNRLGSRFQAQTAGSVVAQALGRLQARADSGGSSANVRNRAASLAALSEQKRRRRRSAQVGGRAVT